MLKTFKLEKIEEEFMSATEGKMTFHLLDENGDRRTVSGTTELDDNQHAVSISTQKKREHPLIQCLFDTEVNETISIEFKHYNTVLERKDDEELAKQTVEDIAREMQGKPVRLGPIIKSVEIKSTETVH